MNEISPTQPTEIGTLAADEITRIVSRATEGLPVTLYAESGTSPLTWDSLADAGWDTVGVVEDGDGATLRDLVAVAQVWGTRCVPVPYLETVLAKRHSPEAREHEGPLTLALPSSTLADGAGLVPFGGFDGVRLVSSLGVGAASFDEVPEGSPDPLDLLAGGREVTLRTTLSDEVARELAIVYAATAVGAARRLLELGIAYAKEREQFGRPIGSFQAVKHNLADTLIAIEEADTATIWGSIDVDAAFRAARFAARRSVNAAERVLQTHGGIGFTWEMGLHFYLRHILSVREIVVGLGQQQY